MWLKDLGKEPDQSYNTAEVYRKKSQVKDFGVDGRFESSESLPMKTVQWPKLPNATHKVLLFLEFTLTIYVLHSFDCFSSKANNALSRILQTVSQPVPCHVHHFLHQNPQAPQHLAPQPGLAATSVAAVAGRAGSSGGDACTACAFKGEAPGMVWKGDFSGVFGVPLGDVFFGASGGVVGTSGGTAGMETRSASSFGSGIEVNFEGSGGKSLGA